MRVIVKHVVSIFLFAVLIGLVAHSIAQTGSVAESRYEKRAVLNIE